MVAAPLRGRPRRARVRSATAALLALLVLAPLAEAVARPLLGAGTTVHARAPRSVLSPVASGSSVSDGGASATVAVAALLPAYRNLVNLAPSAPITVKLAVSNYASSITIAQWELNFGGASVVYDGTTVTSTGTASISSATNLRLRGTGTGSLLIEVVLVIQEASGADVRLPVKIVNA